MFDVVTLGEAMIRLNPPAYLRFSQTSNLSMSIGGSEANTAVGLARLGLKSCWLSRLTRNPLGHLIADTLRMNEVNTDYVTWTDGDRVGLYFLEEGKAPRGSQVYYDRAHSAMSHMTPADLPEVLFQPDRGRLLHLTGITLALSETTRAVCAFALERARAAGWAISFDTNYRSKLWNPAQALDTCIPFMQAADVLLLPLGDARTLFGLPSDVSPEAALSHAAGFAPQAVIVMTLSAQGAALRLPSGEVLYQPAFEAEEVGRVGGGDAFSAGFLYGYITAPADTARALRWGNAAAALKYTIQGDLPLFTFDEVRALAEAGSGASKLGR